MWWHVRRIEEPEESNDVRSLQTNSCTVRFNTEHGGAYLEVKEAMTKRLSQSLESKRGGATNKTHKTTYPLFQ
jgi:hypothetical protein